MTVVADIYDFVNSNKLEAFDHEMIATGTGHKLSTVKATLTRLRTTGRLEKAGRSGMYSVVKHEEMTEENKLKKDKDTVSRLIKRAVNDVVSSYKKGITIAVDDADVVEVNMKREGGKTIYSFVLN